MSIALRAIGPAERRRKRLVRRSLLAASAAEASYNPLRRAADENAAHLGKLARTLGNRQFLGAVMAERPNVEEFA